MQTTQTFLENILIDRDSPAPKGYRIAFVVGLLFLAASFLWLENWHAYYFVQDDNFAQFFPVILDACRALFNEHIFPTINPWQLAGSPTTGLGIYALTYPFTYAAYAIARFILHNEFATIDVFAFIHFTISLAGCLVLLRTLKIRPMLALLASLSYILCGFHLIAGNSWYYMLPVPAYMPWLFLAFEKLRTSPVDWKWSAATGGLIGLAFHSGNAQMWAYAMLFFVMSIMLHGLADRSLFRKWPWITSALLIGIALALPLAAWTLQLTHNIVRVGTSDCDITWGLAAFFLPSPLVIARLPGGWRNAFPDLTGHMYYNGSFFTVIFLTTGVLMAAAWVLHRHDKEKLMRIVQANILIFPAVMAILMAMGEKAPLWPLLAKAPLFDKFSHPFKLLSFIHFFTVISAAICVNRWLNTSPLKKTWQALLWIAFMGLLFYHVTRCQTGLFTYPDTPYPSLPKTLTQMLSADNNKFPQRIDVRAYLRCYDKGYVQSMVHNFPTVYHVLSLKGYENLIKEPENDAEHLFQYGVTMITGSNLPGFMGTTTIAEDVPVNDVLSIDQAQVGLLNKALPMAYLKREPRIALPIKFDVQGAVIDTSDLSSPEDIVVNMIYREGFRAFAGKKELHIYKDRWKKIVIVDCPPERKVRVRYGPPSLTPYTLSILLLLIGASLVMRRRNTASHQPQEQL